MGIRIVPVVASRTMPGQGYRTRVWAGGFVAIGRDGRITVLDGRLEIVDEFDIGVTDPTVAVSHDGATCAWYANGSLVIGDPNGEHTTVAMPRVEHCAWSGDRLWVAHWTAGRFTVEVRDRANRLLCDTTFDDPLHGSGAVFDPHPDADRMLLWFADGGVSYPQVWLLTENGAGIDHHTLPTEREAGSPVFTADGSCFVYGNEDSLIKIAWPGGAELGRLSWREIEPAGADDDALGLDIVPLPDGHALWHTDNGLTHVVDLATMTWAGEVAVNGHPARPASHFFPSLPDDDAPYTGFSGAVRGPHGLLATYGGCELVLTEPRDWVIRVP